VLTTVSVFPRRPGRVSWPHSANIWSRGRTAGGMVIPGRSRAARRASKHLSGA